MKYDIETIRSKERFYSIKDDWNKLLNESQNPNIFLTWEWLYEWFDILGSEFNLYVITVKENNCIIGIAPFILNKNNFPQIKIISYIGSTSVCSDYLDLIIKQGYEEDVTQELFDFLKNNYKEWDIIMLSDMNLNSKNLNIIMGYAKNNNLVSKLKVITKCPYIILPHDFKQFLNRFGHDSRYKFRRSQKKLNEELKSSIIHVNNENDLRKSMDYIFELNSKRWKKAGSKGSFYNEGLRNFNINVSKRFLKNGWLQLDYMTMGDRVIAYCHNFKFKNKIYGYSTSHDPDPSLTKLGPGRILQLKCIENAINSGILEYDLLRGTSEYKYSFSKEERTLVSFTIGRKSFKSILYFFTNNIIDLVITISRAVIPKQIRKKLGEKYLRK
ncbi:MAG TPA: GNAT family N-acetyltransferase [Candidatus Nanoarchaeia archaeon]|nr:GNAT family N-acetyltransferase [Candidatus Nanoarchaeia archaeon]